MYVGTCRSSWGPMATRPSAYRCVVKQEDYSNMFAAALLQGLLNAVSMTWAWALANPWIFLVVAGAVLLRWLEARVRRGEPRRSSARSRR